MKIPKFYDLRECELCGTLFQPVQDTQKFCSRRCSQRAAYEKKKEHLAGKTGGKCPTCGKPTENRLYCSNECKLIARQRFLAKSGEYDPADGKPCETCDSPGCASNCGRWNVWFVYEWNKTVADLRKRLWFTR